MDSSTSTRDGAAVRFVSAAEADPRALAGRTVAVVGYGNLGRSLARNLRDSGVEVVVGNRPDGYRDAAEADGFRVVPIAAAVAVADVVWLLVPDEELAAVVEAEVAPALRTGSAVVFASGYCLAFGLVHLPSDVDVLLAAPRMPGEEVRRTYVDGEGFLTYLSVEQDASGAGWARLVALADAAGGLRRGGLVLSAEREAVLDLFVEQTFGAWLGAAVQAAFEVGVAGGIPAEAMVLELYQSGELARTVAAFARDGFYRSAAGHGATALYGGFVRLADTDPAGLAARFRAILDDIEAGGFAKAFQAERDGGGSTLAVIREMVTGHDPQSEAEDRARAGLSDAG